jgi:thiamine-monophosphate kinase
MPADKKSGLGEFGRIERFFRPLAAGFPGAYTLTDDAASIEVPRGYELVVTTDAIVAGVHFFPDDAPEDVARKGLRVNLSDLAAKGARPLAYTLTLALGAATPDSWVERFAAGLAEDQARYRIHLAGGDSVSTPGPIWLSITAFGLAEAGRMVRRAGAKAGDSVFVTGTIGDAALGLAVARGRLNCDGEDRSALLGRYRLPQPRTALAQTIATHAHAAIDISDGLAADFAHLCRASRVHGEIRVGQVPLSSAARRLVERVPESLSDVLSGGDDYEILLTAAPRAGAALHTAAGAAGIKITEIGRITGACETGSSALIDQAGAPISLERMGWTHG